MLREDKIVKKKNFKQVVRNNVVVRNRVLELMIPGLIMPRR